jgi:hypothetical protein
MKIGVFGAGRIGRLHGETIACHGPRCIAMAANNSFKTGRSVYVSKVM